MIEKTTIARPYAKAIFELASRTREYAVWSTILNTLAFIAEHKKVKPFLRDATLPPQTIMHFFIEVEGSSLSQEAKNLIHLLAIKRRLFLLPEISTLFERFREGAEHTRSAEFTSAVTLNDEQKTNFSQHLSERLKKKIRAEFKVDPSLLAGYTVRIGDDVIDHSVKGFLEQLKASMGGTNGH